MQKTFSVSVLLAYISFTAHAIKLNQEEMMALPEPPINVGNSAEDTEFKDVVTEATEALVEASEPDAENMLEAFDEGTQVVNELIEQAEEEQAAEEAAADECCCNSGCMPLCCDDKDDNGVNLPESLYEDPSVKLEAENLVNALDDIVIDLTLDDLDLDLLDAENLQYDILIPAMEKALADLIAADPSLESQLPSIPTQLQSAADAVMAIV